MLDTVLQGLGSGLQSEVYNCLPLREVHRKTPCSRRLLCSRREAAFQLTLGDYLQVLRVALGKLCRRGCRVAEGFVSHLLSQGLLRLAPELWVTGLTITGLNLPITGSTRRTLKILTTAFSNLKASVERCSRDLSRLISRDTVWASK